MKRDQAREAALGVLVACRQEDAWVDGALKKILRERKLDARDAAFATALAYGVVQQRLWLDHCLGELTDLKKLEPLVLELLRLGSYQIFFMDKVPDSAAIHVSVEMAKAHRLERASGLINAVLRNVARKKEDFARETFSSWEEELSLRTSHPLPLVRRMRALLGEEEAAAFLRCNGLPAPTTIHTNLLKTDAASLRASLEACGVQVTPHPWLADCFTLAASGNLEQLPAFADGLFTVQDAAAKLAAMAAAPRAGERVIDVCAAPGGKSFAMAIAMGGRGDVLSCDVEEHKLRLIEKGAERLGLRCIRTQLADGRLPRAELRESADVVMCDVPCSGLGIIRKKPDVRYKDLSALGALPAIQRAILENASSYVKPGGTLLYSTCTVLPEENEAVTDAFLAAHGDFSYDPFDLPQPLGRVEGHITLWPQRYGTDGFYICRMRRKQG